MGRKKKVEWSPSARSVKWDEQDRKARMKAAGPKEYEKHQWGYKLSKAQPKKKGLGKLKFW